jgi:general stress protein 26
LAEQCRLAAIFQDMQNAVKMMWNLLAETELVMLVDRFGGGLRARPMKVVVADEISLWFLIDNNAVDSDDVNEFPDVCVCFETNNSKQYVSITGIASVVTDQRKREALWPEFDSMSFDAPHNADATLIRVSPIDAEIWSANPAAYGNGLAAPAITHSLDDFNRMQGQP